MNTRNTNGQFEIRRDHRAYWLTAFAAAVLFAASGAHAQNKDTPSGAQETKPTAQTHPTDPMLWDVETMMEQAVQQISKRYSLNPTQEEYTRLLLKNRVREFLDEHETEVRELLQESINMRMGKAPSDPAALKMWAERAMPLYEKASQAILEGNAEWGDILNEDQKKIHEGDLRMMRNSFEGVTNTMKQWKEGNGRPFPVTQQHAANQGGADQSGTENAGAVSDNPSQVEARNIEDNWLSYVNMFVQAYNLKEAAKVSAKEKIYKEQIKKAKDYRERRAALFQRIEKQEKDLDPKDARKRQALHQRLRNLERPIYDLFIEMDERLRKLPTAAQAAEVNETRKEQLEQLYAALSGKKDRDDAKSGRRPSTDRAPQKTDERAPGIKPDDTPKPKTEPAPPGDSDKPSEADKNVEKQPGEPKDGEKKPADPAKDKKPDEKDDAAA